MTYILRAGAPAQNKREGEGDAREDGKSLNARLQVGEERERREANKVPVEGLRRGSTSQTGARGGEGRGEAKLGLSASSSESRGFSSLMPHGLSHVSATATLRDGERMSPRATVGMLVCLYMHCDWLGSVVVDVAYIIPGV